MRHLKPGAIFVATLALVVFLIPLADGSARSGPRQAALVFTP